MEHYIRTIDGAHGDSDGTSASAETPQDNRILCKGSRNQDRSKTTPVPFRNWGRRQAPPQLDSKLDNEHLKRETE